jgi:hypothetical protein
MTRAYPERASGNVGGPKVSELLKQISRCEDELFVAVHRADVLEDALGATSLAVIIYEARGLHISYVNDAARKDHETVRDRMDVSPDSLVGQPLRVLDDIVAIDRRQLDDSRDLPLAGEIELAGVSAVALKDGTGSHMGAILMWPDRAARRGSA